MSVDREITARGSRIRSNENGNALAFLFDSSPKGIFLFRVVAGNPIADRGGIDPRWRARDEAPLPASTGHECREAPARLRRRLPAERETHLQSPRGDSQGLRQVRSMTARDYREGS